MTSEELNKLINDHKSLTTRTYDQKTYKIGVNSAIYQDQDKASPDNRIPTPYIRRAMKLLKGYFAKTGNITYADTTGWFNEYIAHIYNDNHEQIKTAQIFEDAATYGRGFELHWYGEDEEFYFDTLPIAQCIPIYSDDLSPLLIGFVWYREMQNGDHKATYYNDTEYIEYVQSESQAGDKKQWKINEENSGIHLYGRVPVLEAIVDRDKKNLFDHCLPMIDFYDRLTSNTANEHEKFAEAILLLRDFIDDVTEDDNGRTQVDKMNDYRILDRLGDKINDSAAYLERNVNDTFIENTLDRYERQIYEMLCIVNYSASDFAEASGRAQAYKLLGQELMIADIESYFSTFLYDRINLIAYHQTSGIKTPEESANVQISFKRNLPFDLETTIGLLSVAIGGKQVISHKTALKLLPDNLVKDAEEELAQIAIENPGLSDPTGNAE